MMATRRRKGAEAGYNDNRYSSPSLVLRSSSTPYDLYQARSRKITGEGNSSGTSPTPFVTHTPHVARQSYSIRASGLSTPADSNSPISLKGSVVASPSLRGAASSNARHSGVGRLDATQSDGGKESKGAMRQKRISRAFVRRKTIKQRFESLPTDVLDHITAIGFTLSESLQDSALGYPLGGLLHLLSLTSHLISPSSDLSLALLFGVDVSSTQAASVFGNSQGVGGVNAKGGLKNLRKAAKAARVNAWSWMAATLSLSLLVIAFYNAYVLFSSRRKYRLWMRKQEDQVMSENHRLVPVHLEDEEDEPSIQEKLRAFILKQLNEVPILNWFIPDVPDLGEGRHRLDAQIHELNVWEAPDVPLRIATIYSPLHASLWHLAGTSFLPIGGFVAWSSLFIIMALISAQTYLIVIAFSNLIKDKSLLAAEVMREYDQTFVLPRAMPEVRDACVQTSQAETISPEDWLGTPSGIYSSRTARASQGSPSSSSPLFGVKKGGRGGRQSRLRHNDDST